MPILLALVAGLALASLVIALTNASAGEPGVYHGKSAEGWHWRYTQAHKAHSHLGAEVRSARQQIRALSRQLAIHGESVPIIAIRLVFGNYASEAIRVSSCETGGTFSTNSTNGQYLGLFQMGNYARGRYGHSSSALGQAQAAYRYFVDSGRDWSPWECKP